MFKTILVAFDGSPPARACADLVVACAARWQARVVFCDALDTQRLLVPAFNEPPSAFDMLGSYRRDASALLEERSRLCRGAGVSCDTSLPEEPPREGILNAARAAGADLIAMGTHGRSGPGRAMLGSITEDVLRHSALPVLTVRKPVSVTRFRRIAVAMDESACAARALSLAADIAAADNASLHVVHVSRGRFDLEGAVHDVAGRIPELHILTEHDAGDTGLAIGAFADRIHADLIAIGSHGRSGIVCSFVGSVAETTIRHAACPVLAAR